MIDYNKLFPKTEKVYINPIELLNLPEKIVREVPEGSILCPDCGGLGLKIQETGGQKFIVNCKGCGSGIVKQCPYCLNKQDPQYYEFCKCEGGQNAKRIKDDKKEEERREEQHQKWLKADKIHIDDYYKAGGEYVCIGEGDDYVDISDLDDYIEEHPDCLEEIYGTELTFIDTQRIVESIIDRLSEEVPEDYDEFNSGYANGNSDELKKKIDEWASHQRKWYTCSGQLITMQKNDETTESR